MERWFQNTRGLVIVVLAVVTCILLLATEPGDGASSVASNSSTGGSSTVTTVTTLPAVTTTAPAAQHPTIQEGSTGADVIVLQQRLNALGYDVGTADGTFGPGTKAQVVKFQTAKGITPADGVVNQKTWDALLANPAATPTPTTTTKR